MNKSIGIALVVRNSEAFHDSTCQFSKACLSLKFNSWYAECAGSRRFHIYSFTVQYDVDVSCSYTKYGVIISSLDLINAVKT